MFPEHNDTATMIPAAHGDRNDEMLQKNKMLQKNIFLFSCNKRTPLPRYLYERRTAFDHRQNGRIRRFSRASSSSAVRISAREHPGCFSSREGSSESSLSHRIFSVYSQIQDLLCAASDSNLYLSDGKWYTEANRKLVENGLSKEVCREFILYDDGITQKEPTLCAAR